MDPAQDEINTREGFAFVSGEGRKICHGRVSPSLPRMVSLPPSSAELTSRKFNSQDHATSFRFAASWSRLAVWRFLPDRDKRTFAASVLTHSHGRAGGQNHGTQKERRARKERDVAWFFVGFTGSGKRGTDSITSSKNSPNIS